MKCPNCHADNTDTAKFCSNCATSLTYAKMPPPALTETLKSPVRLVAPGTLFAGRYEIVGPLGAGGMGEVYRALDKNLSRHVAIKILPEAFAEDGARMARFEREAKLLAVLNHPNIAAIHGLEESEGRRFIVLELADGETLQIRLNSGAFPIEDSLDVCRQLAEGLEAAHEKGIIHRDLKPGNIMISQEAKVKILDFGLAKAYGGETTGVDIQKSPTITAQMTEPGVILGTAAYMSPEQARGRSVDKRADIWAFGCVLYECLTGTRAFYGETVSDTLAHILKGEPDWSKLPAETPLLIKVLLRRCLEKDPKRRLHDIADARIEIADALSQPFVSEPVPMSKPRGMRNALILVLGVMVIGLAATVISMISRKTPGIPIIRATLDLPEGLHLTGGVYELDLVGPLREEIALSPDGRYLIYSASPDGTAAKAKLYLRLMDSTEAKPISGTEGARGPFFSPDGQWIGFWAQGKMFKVSPTNGLPIPLCDLRDLPVGSSWGSNGRIIIGTIASGLQSLDALGGKLEALTIPDSKKETTHRLPYVLPGGKAVLFTVMPHTIGARAWIEVLSLGSGKRKVLIEGGMDARYVPTGHLVYMRKGTLMAVPFDPQRLEIRGTAVPVVEGVMQALGTGTSDWNSGTGQFSFSDTGSLIYMKGGVFAEHENQLVWIDRQGKVERITSLGRRPFGFQRISPDGQKVVYSIYGMNNEIWLYDLLRGTSSRLTSDGCARSATWTPDAKHFTISYSITGPLNLYGIPSDGSGSLERLAISDNRLWPGSWSPDGRFLAYVEEGNPGGENPSNDNIMIFRKDDKQSVRFTRTNYNEAYPEFSPEGHWLAFVSNESGRSEIYVTEFPGPGRKIMISNEGGVAPVWARNGHELYYWNLTLDRLMVVDITIQPTFTASPPRMLFKAPIRIMGSHPIGSCDITPDDRKFLVVELSAGKPADVRRLSFVQSWFDELKRLVPAGKS